MLLFVIKYSLFCLERTLSVEQLMKFCPYETLEIPIPVILKSLYYIPEIKNSIVQHELIDLTRISLTMLTVFFDLIKKNNHNSALQVLDLGLFPLRKYISVPLCNTLENILFSSVCVFNFTK